MKINNYKPILQNDIYPKLSSMVDAAFPEFEFKEKGKQWISTNTLHLSGIEGVHGKGKVTVLKSKPYAIGDFREGTKEVINYLVGSAFHPQVTDFKNAVEYLASITNVELNNTSIITDWKRKKFVPKPIQQTKPIYIPTDLFKASLSDYDNNDFAQYLNRLLGTEKAKELIERFYIGTSKYWNGPTTVFWLIDIKNCYHFYFPLINGMFCFGGFSANYLSFALLFHAEVLHKLQENYHIICKRMILRNFNLSSIIVGNTRPKNL